MTNDLTKSYKIIYKYDYQKFLLQGFKVGKVLRMLKRDLKSRKRTDRTNTELLNDYNRVKSFIINYYRGL